ncbi:hypothetical protein Dsin_009406 [Dipteronia sinensis]|uniref:RNase H type-1 domain-containing protein n=1 Tax=Dipteronia sinensis TaxID=43782 RepID=A0AAE0EBQ3_9ROSI|nr:hypothetical protein Dsin_009406 [Dipteronia sinensis]
MCIHQPFSHNNVYWYLSGFITMALSLHDKGIAVVSRAVLLLWGVVAVIRDSAGEVIAAIWKIIVGVFSAEVGEFLALREGLFLAEQLHLCVSWVESDATNVVAGVNSNVISLGVEGPLILDIQLFKPYVKL